MTTNTRTLSPATASLPGLRAFVSRLGAAHGNDPERAERRRVAREIASYPAARGVGMPIR